MTRAPIPSCLLAVATLIGLASVSPGAPIHYDTDADGVIDLTLDDATSRRAKSSLTTLAGGAPLRDGDGDGDLDPPRPTDEPIDGFGSLAETYLFDLVWTSPATVSNPLCVEVGDADGDGRLDFAGPGFAPNTLHLFESDGADGYAPVWSSTDVFPPGGYRDIAFADTDGDGLGEILGGELSTLGMVMLFEQSAGGFDFVHDLIREPDLTGALRLRRVLVGDTDGDQRQEVIVCTGGSSPTGGRVAIWEHTGAVGDNTYERVFVYETVSYLFQATLGDSDNDGIPEVVLGLGGLGGNPLVIRRLEFDASAQTWVHSSFTSSVTGLGLAPLVADLDGDLDNELAYGSTSFAVVFEHTGGGQYGVAFQSPVVFAGNVLAMAAGNVGTPAHPSLATGAFSGELALWTFDPAGGSFVASYFLADAGGPVQQVALADDAEDGFQELIPAVTVAEQLRVYRRRDTVGLGDVVGVAAVPPRLRVATNPVAGTARFSTTGPIDAIRLFDVHGRSIRTLRGATVWDLRSDSGQRVPSGIYWAVPDAAGRAGPAAVVRFIVTN